MTDKAKGTPSPEMVEGPFYAGGGPSRADLREGQQGQELQLTIRVVDVQSSAPVAGVEVDVWHCNATGHYSGYDVNPDEIPENISNGQPVTNNENFLRGRQTTDSDGKVRFHTIVPGWYALRTPHIHVKIFEGGQCNVTTQLYLPEDLNQALQNREAYFRDGEQDTFNKTDPVIGNTSGDIESLWIDIEESGEVLRGSATLSIVPGNVNEQIIVPPGRIPPLGGGHIKKLYASFPFLLQRECQ